MNWEDNMISKAAKINDIDGMGQASVVQSGNLKEVSGFFIPNNVAMGFSLMDSKNTKFSGVLYDGAKETMLEFDIVIYKVTDESVFFKGSGNPYA